MNEYEKARQYLQIALNSAAQCSDEYGVNQSGYYEIGTAIKALEKQIPKKFEIWNGQCYCPNCNKLFGNYSQLKTLIHWEMPYCKFCGQALDWSDTD